MACQPDESSPGSQLPQESEGGIGFRGREAMGVGFRGPPHLQPVVLGARGAHLHRDQLLERQALGVEVGHDARPGPRVRAAVVGALHAEVGCGLAQLLGQLAVQPGLQTAVMHADEAAGEAEAPIKAHLHLREREAGSPGRPDAVPGEGVGVGVGEGRGEAAPLTRTA